MWEGPGQLRACRPLGKRTLPGGQPSHLEEAPPDPAPGARPRSPPLLGCAFRHRRRAKTRKAGRPCYRPQRTDRIHHTEKNRRPRVKARHPGRRGEDKSLHPHTRQKRILNIYPGQMAPPGFSKAVNPAGNRDHPSKARAPGNTTARSMSRPHLEKQEEIPERRGAFRITTVPTSGGKRLA